MIAQISLEEHFFQKSKHTKPSNPKTSRLWSLRIPTQHLPEMVSQRRGGGLSQVHAPGYKNSILLATSQFFTFCVRGWLSESRAPASLPQAHEVEGPEGIGFQAVEFRIVSFDVVDVIIHVLG
jgi:hypothetical protein